MGIVTAQLVTRLGASALAALSCLPAVAAESGTAPGLELFGQPDTVATEQPFAFGLGIEPGLEFDLGGSETRKLELQLERPISLRTGTRLRLPDAGPGLFDLDATLSVPLADGFNLSAGLDRQAGAAQFQSLGSIECHNGILRADSYTASGCRFVNEPMVLTDRQQLDLGARIDFGNSSASVNWFRQNASIDANPAALAGLSTAPTTFGPGLLSPNLGNPLVGGSGSEPLQFLNSEATGVDLRFKVGIATDNSGDIQLGLAFGRILDAEFDGAYGNGFDALSWTVAEAFNTARMSLEWNRGAFSSGLSGYYREPVSFLNRDNLDSLATFDVHFTWHTPWNADLSVGASNVLDAGVEPGASVEAQPVDPLESIYGRIPYVRYKQDL